MCMYAMYMYIIIRVYTVHVHVLGVLCCFALFVCLTLLASFFLPSHLSFKNMYISVLKAGHMEHLPQYIYIFYNLWISISLSLSFN